MLLADDLCVWNESTIWGVQRSTSLTNWVTILTTNSPGNGLFNYMDNFSDLGVVPASAYYRLQWNP
jgi:hypothetical protein